MDIVLGTIFSIRTERPDIACLCINAFVLIGITPGILWPEKTNLFAHSLFGRIQICRAFLICGTNANTIVIQLVDEFSCLILVRLYASRKPLNRCNVFIPIFRCTRCRSLLLSTGIIIFLLGIGTIVLGFRELMIQ